MGRVAHRPRVREDLLAREPPSSTVGEPSWPRRFEEFFGGVLDAFQAAGVPFLLGGAFALNVHTGIWRDTKDLDVFLPARSVGDALAAAEGAGFETETVYAEWLSRIFRAEAFVDVIHHGANALVGVDDAWLARGVPVRILGREALALSAEDLVWSKLYVVSRNRCDVPDVHHVLYRAGGTMDWRRLVANVGEDAGLLLGHLHVFRWAYPDAEVVPAWVFGELDERAARAPGGFRGTLLDVVSYRVDVDAWGLDDAQARARSAVLAGLSP